MLHLLQCNFVNWENIGLCFYGNCLEFEQFIDIIEIRITKEKRKAFDWDWEEKFVRVDIEIGKYK